MKPYALSVLPEGDIQLWEAATRIVRELPDLRFKDDRGEKGAMSCHILARAVGKVLRLEVRDGYAIIGFEHSWLVTENGNILDLYPVATLGGPLLIDGHTLYARQIYLIRTTREISRGRFGNGWFQEAVKKTIRAILSNKKAAP